MTVAIHINGLPSSSFKKIDSSKWFDPWIIELSGVVQVVSGSVTVQHLRLLPTDLVLQIACSCRFGFDPVARRPIRLKSQILVSN